MLHSIPVGRAVEVGDDRVFVAQVGRVGRPLKTPTKAVRSPERPSESPVGNASAARWRDSPYHATAHVIPLGGLDAHVAGALAGLGRISR